MRRRLPALGSGPIPGAALDAAHTAIEATGFKSLNEGDKVEFDMVQEPKGPKVQNIVKVSQGPAWAGAVVAAARGLG